MFAQQAAAIDFRRSCIRVMAFLGRYGHQQVPHMLAMPVSFLSEFATEVGEIMQGERDQWAQAMADGGS